MLNKIKMMVLVVIVAIATLGTATLGTAVIATIAINNNNDITEAKEQIELIDSTKETKHEVDVYNLGYMINGYSKQEVLEAGLTKNEVVTIVKDNVKEKAVVSFSNDLLVLNTKDDLNNKISSISSGIYATTMGIACVVLTIVIAVIASIIEHIDNMKHKKEMSIIKNKRIAELETVLVEAEAVLVEASELEANIVDNNIYVDILKHMELIHYMKIVCHTTSKKDILDLRNAMDNIVKEF